MKLICLVKLVPDVESFTYDFDRNVLLRDSAHQIVNPEDATAIALALDIKRESPNTTVETLSMAPMSALPHVEDLIRRGVDRATLISDARYVGSDTYVSSRILARYLEGQPFDWILSGTHSLDGGTAHVPSQIAEILGIPQLSEVIDLDRHGLMHGSTIADVDTEDAVLRFAVDRPAVLSLQYSTRLSLPYIPYETMESDVRDGITVIDNDRLGFAASEIGLGGSLTRVVQAEARRSDQKDTLFVRCDDAGVESVYRFLKQNGFVP